MNIDRRDFEKYLSNHTIRETAEYFDICPRSVTNLRIRIGLATKRDATNALSLSERQQNIIIGSLLGDGHLTTPRKDGYNSYFQESHGKQQKYYCKWKFDELKPFGKKFFKALFSGFGIKSPGFTCRTICHPWFTRMEKKWYRRDIAGKYVLNKTGYKTKIIPCDIELLPLTLAVFYLDDGCNVAKKRYVTLAGHAFEREDLDILINKIKMLGITNCTMQSGPLIYIGASSYLDFIDLITPHIKSINCMAYKIDLGNYIAPKVRVKGTSNGWV